MPSSPVAISLVVLGVATLGVLVSVFALLILVIKRRQGSQHFGRLVASPDEVFENKRRLRELYDASIETHSFHVGQFVRWKSGLKNKRRPLYKELAIVVEVFDKPIFDLSEEHSGTPYFREPLDIILALVDDDGDFVYFHYDSRRFEPIDRH